MTETAGPDRVRSTEQIGLSAREAATAPVPHATGNAPPRNAAQAAGPRDAASWARKVDRLEVDPRAGVRGTNVAGRRLTGPVQGFGKMWQKSYRMKAGPGIAPEQAIATWREHFPEFWPKGNRFAGALTGINPGDVALLDLAIGGGVKLSTGVFVLYADAESFTLMTPQGHMFAGWITFSAEREAEETVVQALVLMRANDPLYEIAMTFGGHRQGGQVLGRHADRAGGAARPPEPGRGHQDHLRGHQTPVASRQQRLAQLDDPQRVPDHRGPGDRPGPYASSQRPRAR